MWTTQTEYAERAPTRKEIDVALEGVYTLVEKHYQKPLSQELLVSLYEDYLEAIMAENDTKNNTKEDEA